MRYNRKVWFVNEAEPVYDDLTGDYLAGKVERIFRYASISTTGEESQNMLYGKIKEGALTVLIQNTVEAPFQYIEVDEEGKKYLVDNKRKTRRGLVLRVSESQ